MVSETWFLLNLVGFTDMHFQRSLMRSAAYKQEGDWFRDLIKFYSPSVFSLFFINEYLFLEHFYIALPLNI